ncbi:MAG: DEAD/DEAH box helicase [Candidatus Omnitrophota bacterium]
MIPSVIASQLKQGVDDFLRTTFPISTPLFHGLVEDLLNQKGSIFKGPYVSINLPFRNTSGKKEFFTNIPFEYDPYIHQLKAFERLSGETPRSTVIATGTGSGKTECFLYPIMDYCYNHRNEKGIKAIIIYPMNALATNQATRIARMIYQNQKLRGHITAGLFIGQNEQDSHVGMTADGIITNKDILRDNPPDILLTNYKMLDYLLIRVKDRELWQNNDPKTLKYLVVDELHTFDGAQGTDLACLIRRLKDRLKMPQQHLCCVGTSATIGSDKEIEKLLVYVKDVFNEPFDKTSVITEDRISVSEYLTKVAIAYTEIPSENDSLALKPDQYNDSIDYLNKQYSLWFKEGFKGDLTTSKGRIALGQNILKHRFFHNVLRILKGKVVTTQNLINELKRISIFRANAEETLCLDTINSMCALISFARSDEHNIPFLNVRYQLWMRELRRMVAQVGSKPFLTFADDLKGDQENKFLPIVHCRECGCTGWGGVKKDEDSTINNDLKEFYFNFFKKQPWLVFLFPCNEDELKLQLNGETTFICGKCLTLTHSTENKCPSCQNNNLVRVFIPYNLTTTNGRVKSNNNCPYCGSHGGLTIMGSRAASLTSVLIGQLFASRYNNHKKLVTFSDSVQDAALHAGFFGARTYSLNFRAALQQMLNEIGKDKTLSELPDLFIKHWTDKLGVEKYIATFIAHNMEWFPEYEQLKRRGTSPQNSDLKKLVDNRIGWEIFSEYGYRARIGRTLEKGGVSCAYPVSKKMDEVIEGLSETLRNEIGVFRDIDINRFRSFILGFIMRMKLQGGVYSETLETYIQSNGNSYRLNNIPYMPSFSQGSRAPVFLTNKRQSRFDTLLSAQNRANTWYENWFSKCFREIPLIANYAEDVYKIALNKLEDKNIFKKTIIRQDQAIWGILPESLQITTNVAQMRCIQCGHTVSVSNDEIDYWNNMSCLRLNCWGRYLQDAFRDDYYGKLYSIANIYRIFAHEHTGLLTRTEREDIEKRFIHNDKPWDPNLLSATPTLEMGIDIGDLSSVFLCSVPPAQTNYLQRIGRSGRADGNAFNVTVAEGMCHDLYFYADPEEMISGEIFPPGVYLNASAILERQFVAFCLDRWVDSGIGQGEFPLLLGKVLNNIDSHNDALFPYTFLKFIQESKDILLKRFFGLFADVLDNEAKKHLNIYVEGDEKQEGTLEHKVINSLEFVCRERESYKKRVDKLRQIIRKKESDPAARDQNYEKELNELRRERTGLQGLIKSINSKDTLNFFTDEGFLPNYAFPEAGVILKSLVFRKKQKSSVVGEEDENKSNYDHWVYEYERPAVSAIQELAPANTFYANGRKVEIDQVDLSLSEPQMWRFCDDCAYSECTDVTEEKSSCPRCGSSMWTDSGQQKKMLRLRQVFATSSDKRSRIGDDADERAPVFYNKQMLVDFDEQHIKEAYRVTDESFPFGFEFINKATFREINFGERGEEGEDIRIAGVESKRNGFQICRFCGKVQKEGMDPRRKHDLSCSARGKDDESVFTECLYLYREFSSEAIRILLPISQCLESPQKTHSFIAALQVGLKERFGGAVDHLQTALNDEPNKDSMQRKQYLMLYDRIPGGTGYLKELMRSPKPLFDVFEKALGKLKQCECAKDPEKDGCYRCIYAYRNSYDMSLTSRNTAIELLTEILKHKDALTKIDSLRNVNINAFSDSVLETLFIEAIKGYKKADTPIQVFQEIVNKKPGYFIKIGVYAYYVEPQVTLDNTQGVSIPSKADFVFWPARSHYAIKPIAVFADGFNYHKDRVGLDTAQRMAIVQSDKFYVWSITWKDVDVQIKSKESNYYDNILDCGILHNQDKYRQFLELFNAEQIGQISKESNLDWLISLLSNPDDRLWARYAFVRCLLWINPENNDKADFKKKLSAEITPNIQELYNELDEKQLMGAYQHNTGGDTENIKVYVSISPDDVQNKNYNNGFFVVHLIDKEQKEVFERAWISFLRLYNLMQFLPMSFYLTSTGIAKGAYDRFLLDRAHKREKENIDIDLAREWQEITELAGDEFKALIEELLKEKVTIPEVGYELQLDNGEIIAEAELAWESKKIAILSDKQNSYKEIFTQYKWKIFMIADAIGQITNIIANFK